MANLVLTPEWVEGIYQLETSDPVMGGADGIDNRQAIQLGNRTAYLKNEVGKRAPLANPTFTGTPKAPTPTATSNDTTIATTAFVKTALAALVGSAPATLDTLAEIATALGSDGNLKATLLAEIAKKATVTDFNALKDSLIGVPIPYPLSTPPTGYLMMMGQAFNKTTYPKLAQKYPSGVLPDLRGEFIRGWDNGRGVDSWRGLLSLQEDAIRNIQGDVKYIQYAFYSVTTGAFYRTNEVYATSTGLDSKRDISAGGMGVDDLAFDASRVVPTANENRPRNISFNYVCLAG